MDLDPTRRGRLVRLLAKISRDYLAEQESAAAGVSPPPAADSTPGTAPHQDAASERYARPRKRRNGRAA